MGTPQAVSRLWEKEAFYEIVDNENIDGLIGV